jgi:uncharacterized RDD family membrane protein YckC
MTTIDSKQISVGLRLGTMILDHFFMTIVAMVFFIPSMISGFSDAFNVSHEQTNPNFMGGPLGIIGLFGFALYFCKDVINGRSIAKRILKLQIVDNATGQVASPIKCFVRNILCVLWPIEVIVAMTNPSRRLGDRIAGTKLVTFDPILEQPKLNIGMTLLPIGIAFGLILLLKGVMPSFEGQNVDYSKTSYNQPASRELEKLLTGSLGKYLTPSVKIYDTIRNENVKYVSAILTLKENYLEDENTYDRLNSATNQLIYSKLPKETFTGQIKYIYQTNGQMQARTIETGKTLTPRTQK